MRIKLEEQHVSHLFVGTGAVKLTPAHDANDFAAGKRHGLGVVCVFAEDGTINAAGGQFAGMRRFDARVAVLAALKEQGLFRGKAANEMRLGVCSRSKDVIEPMLKPQVRYYLLFLHDSRVSMDAVVGVLCRHGW